MKRMKIVTLLTIILIIIACHPTVNTNDKKGIFDKLLGKKSSNKKEKSLKYFQDIEKTSEMLDEKTFWDIVDKSLKDNRNEELQITWLVKEIEKLTPKDIIGFRLRTDKLLYDTYNSEMWCAGYIMNGGCSDDGFEYFRNWVISRGKEVYFNTKKNPDSLISQYVDNKEYYELEDFWYVALTAFKNKTGKDLYDFISEDFKKSEGNYPQFEFNWKEEEPETMKAICPLLFEKMWN